MIVDLMLRRRAALTEFVPQLNEQIVHSFASILGFWATDGDAVFNPGNGESATLDLRKALAPGLKGQQIFYAPRLGGYLNRDTSQSDDFLSFKIDTEKIDYREFCLHSLPLLISIFDSYRATVETDREIRQSDWKDICDLSKTSGRDIDGRDTVFRVWPVNFFDDLLCQRSFGIGAGEVVRRLAPECERAEVLNSGAFILITSEVITGAALNELNKRAMRSLFAS